jgi:ankyrin repeat protein
MKDARDTKNLFEMFKLTAMSQSIETNRMVINLGLDLLSPNEEGYTPLHIACLYGRLDIVKMLLEKNPNLIQLTENLRQAPTPLALSLIGSELGNSEIAKFLLENGARLNIPDSCGNYPIHYAFLSDNVELIKFVLEKHPDEINRTATADASCLHLTILKDSYKASEYIIQKFKEQINQKDSQGNTPLHIASKVNNTKFIELFLKYNADINITNNDGDTPLHLLSKHDVEHSIMESFLKHGADINQKNFYLLTPLDIATMKNALQNTKYFLMKGAEIGFIYEKWIMYNKTFTQAKELQKFYKLAQTADKIFYESKDINIMQSRDQSDTIEFIVSRIQRLYEDNLTKPDALEIVNNFNTFLKEHTKDNGLFDELKTKLLLTTLPNHENKISEPVLSMHDSTTEEPINEILGNIKELELSDQS